jgi:superfamily II DNA or RNA helicase
LRKYDEFLASKRVIVNPSGFDAPKLSNKLYDFQRDLDRWAIRRGKAALFTMTGTGKTPMQVTFADAVCGKTDKPTLIFAPLAVAKQSVREAKKFDINVKYVRSQSECSRGVNIANYEMMQHFRADEFAGLILDESSILKSFTGQMRNDIIAFAQSIPYRLACTATPAPNDYMELGNHAEFLGVMSYNEMLATFFVHDGGDTAKWRLKGHAIEKFWKWLAQWGVFLINPSDLGYSDEGFILPELITHEHVIKSPPAIGQFFATEAKTLQERRGARKDSLPERVNMCIDIVKNKLDKPALIWCNLNAESVAVAKGIKGAVEITGSDSNEHKEKTMLDFADGKIDVVVTKPSIAGFGMNWQVCHETVFLGLSDSFEQMFQATKRFHRHGQKHIVNRHIIISESEGAVLKNVQRKEREFMQMIGEMVKLTKDSVMENLKSSERQTDEYNANEKVRIPKWLVTENN